MRVLIIRLSSMGDIVLTTPILRDLKEKYPEIVIDYLVMDAFKEAISGNPHIDNLILFDKRKNDGLIDLIRFGLELRKNNYTYVFDLHSKLRSRILSFLIGAKLFRYKKRKFIKTLLVKLRLMRYKVDDTIVRNYYKPFKDLGLFYSGEKLEFYFDKASEERIENLEIDFKNTVAIAPGASKETKKWRKDGFSELIRLIVKKYEKSVVLIGAESERKMCEEIIEQSGVVAENLAGRLTLKESGALLSKVRFLVTNDSGPFHVARGVKTPTYVIFGPTSPDMFEYDNKNILIYAKVDCSPCSLHGDKRCPKGHFKCMNEVKATDILEIIENSGRL